MARRRRFSEEPFGPTIERLMDETGVTYRELAARRRALRRLPQPPRPRQPARAVERRRRNARGGARRRARALPRVPPARDHRAARGDARADRPALPAPRRVAAPPSGLLRMGVAAPRAMLTAKGGGHAHARGSPGPLGTCARSACGGDGAGVVVPLGAAAGVGADRGIARAGCAPRIVVSVGTAGRHPSGGHAVGSAAGRNHPVGENARGAAALRRPHTRQTSLADRRSGGTSGKPVSRQRCTRTSASMPYSSSCR